MNTNTLNRKCTNPSELCLHHWFEKIADQYPDYPAVHDSTGFITYKELNIKANKVAAHLKAILPPDFSAPICIYTPSSISFVVAKLAILKCGSAYVPLDVKYPLDRLENVIRQTGSPFVLINNLTADFKLTLSVDQINIDDELSFEKYSGQDSERHTNWNSLAYIIFTSGSTGEPKGVMITHRNLVHLIHWGHRAFQMYGGENAAQTARIVFDASVWEFWSNLLCGNTIHILDQNTMLDMVRCNQWLIENQIHYLFMPTPIGELFLDSDWHNNKILKHLQCGGERLLKRPHPDFPAVLTNIYGPTETTVCISTKAVECENPQHRTPSIGKAVDFSRIYILDETLQPVQVGATGEIHISGELVGPGYWKRDDLTQKSFIPDPFCDETNALMYRTGDLGRFYPNGEIDFVGRIDFQVKIRGFRIELGEIETVLSQHPSLNECIVMAVELSPGTTSLVAYYTLKDKQTADKRELRDLAKSKLPDYMIPDYYEILTAFPLTNNGKIDRKAFPRPVIAMQESKEVIFPKSDLEIRVADIWKSILRTTDLSMDDRFYELGGHSLKATQIISQIRQLLGYEIDIVFMLNNPSLRETVNKIQQKNQSRFQSIPANRDRYIYPLSWSQQGMWYYWHLDPKRVDYNIRFRIDIQGKLNIHIFRKALDLVAEQHETLRTRFFMQDGMPVSEILSPRPVDFDVIEVSGHKQESIPRSFCPEHNELIPYPIASEELDDLCSRMDNVHFDLHAGYLMRAALADCGNESFILFITIHHIITDGWSMGIFMRDLRIAYSALLNGAVPILNKPSIRYGDYASWQRSVEPQVLYPQQQMFWKNQLLPLAPVLSLPNGSHINTQTNVPGKRVWWRLDDSLAQSIISLTRHHGKSLFSFMLTVYQILLQRYTQETDIVVGSSYAGRQLSETEDIVGIFTNLMVFRTKVSGELRFKDLWNSVHDYCAHAFANSDYPFDQLVLDLETEAGLSGHPLFNHMFLLQNFSLDQTDFAGLDLHFMDIGNHTAKFDFLFTVEEWHKSLICWFEYSPDYIEDDVAVNMAKQIVHLCEEIVLDPEKKLVDYEILLPAEKHKILYEWNTTFREFPLDKSYIDLFRNVVSDSPESIAVTYEADHLSYAELDTLSDNLAAHLLAMGVRHQEIVGLALGRSLWLPVSLLAIWKAGATYLPIDTTFPTERIRLMLKTASVSLVITETEFSGIILPFTGAFCLDDPIHKWQEPCRFWETTHAQPDDIAYVMFTSGSTGIPKGVKISTRNLVNHNFAVMDAFQLSPADRVLQFGSISFDLSAEEIFPTLLCGATLVLRNEKVLDSLDYFLDFVRQESITVIDIPTAYWHELVLLLEYKPLPPSIRLCIIGGEKAQTDRLHIWQRVTSPQVRLMNTYGPTETTIIATIYEPKSVDTMNSAFPIGKPIANVQTYILDSRQNPVPVGAPGELYISGAGVSPGYLANQELTSERFVPCLFAPDQSALMYNTGDIAFYDKFGNIHFLGRKDAQVKLLGHRIELSEIEQHLSVLEVVKTAIVLLSETDTDHQFLCAYIVPALENVVADDLKKILQNKLPDYMIPSVFVFVDEIPLTTQGKVNRRALPPPNVTKIEKQTSLPHTPLQQAIAQIWMNVLNLQAMDINTPFRDLGGHSLKAMLTLSLLEKELGVTLSLREFLSHSTIRDLAAFLDQEHKVTEAIQTTDIVPASRASLSYPLSFAQEGLWFLWELDETRISYNIPMVYYISGYLDPELMIRSWLTLFNRHEVFRTRFTDTEGIPEVALDCPLPTKIGIVDYSEKPQSIALALALRLQKTVATTALDLTTGPLFVVKLIKLADDQWQVLFVIHHIIADGWSIALLSRELQDIYTGFINPSYLTLPPVSLQYVDYALWQRGKAGDKLPETQSVYWKSKLLPLPETLNLPYMGIRPAFQSYRGRQIRFEIEADELYQWNQLCRQSDISLFMLLYTGISVLLSNYSRQADIIIGSPFANRKAHQLENLVGCFTNMLALRTVIEPDQSFTGLLEKARITCLDAYAISEYPFFLLPGLLEIPRDPSRHPLYQVMLTLQNYPTPVLDFAGLTVTTDIGNNDSAKVDLGWDFSQSGDSLSGILEYNTDLFEFAFCQRMVQNLVSLLHQACRSPHLPIAELSCLSPEEYNYLISDLNSTARVLPDQSTVLSWITANCNQFGDRLAVTFDSKTFTYSDIQQLVQSASGHLIKNQIQPGDVVGLYLERSPEMLVAALACWGARAAYLYLDPAFPPERLAFMAEESSLKLIITDKALPESFLRLNPAVKDSTELFNAQNPILDLPSELSGSTEDIAYIIFTSGSTGKPKAVQISHLSVINLLASMQIQPGIEPGDILAAITPMSFDISVLELFLPLVTGATLVILPTEAAVDALLLARLLSDNKVTLFQATPSTYKMLIDSGWTGKSDLTALCGGEALSRNLGSKLLPLVKELWNMYGPTETTVWSTLYQVTESDKPVLIGKPIANTSLYVLNASLQPVPWGAWGELYIGGLGVARGYYNQPELTASGFIPNPFNPDRSDRLYKTGDLVRINPDGLLEYGGRNDFQVKLRGHRIEPEEIAHLLRRHPDILDAVVTVQETESKDSVLVSYLISSSAQQPRTDDLKSFLSRDVPDYMIPSHFVWLEKFPLTANGKINLKELPAPDFAKSDPEIKQIMPFTPEQEILCKAVSDVLHIPVVGVNENFFALGGNSILTMKLINLIHKSGLTVSVDNLFRHRTLEDLAGQLKIRLAQTNTFGSESLILLQKGKTGSIPLFLIHPLPGDVLGYVNLVQQLSPEITVYGIQSLGLTDPQKAHSRITDMAAYYLNIIRQLDIPKFYLGGWCFGGSIAIEMAYQANRIFDLIPRVFLFDTWAFNPAPERNTAFWLHRLKVMYFNWRRIPFLLRNKLKERKGFQVIFDRDNVFQDQGIFENRSLVRKANLNSLWSWKMHWYHCPIVLFRALEQHPDTIHDWTLGWTVFASNLTVHPVEATHDNILKQPQVRRVAEILSSYLG